MTSQTIVMVFFVFQRCSQKVHIIPENAVTPLRKIIFSSDKLYTICPLENIIFLKDLTDL